MTMKLRRVRVPDTTEVRLTTSQGEDIGRAQDGTILYPDNLALEIVQSINGRKLLVKDIQELEKELAQYKADPKAIKRLDLKSISRSSKDVYTSIAFEGALQEMFTQDRVSHPWLTFGECSIRNDNICYIESPIRDGITDFEHDTCLVLRIGLVGVQHTGTYGHTSYFTAYITPNPKEILIQSPDFIPEKVDQAEKCEHCTGEDAGHLILPENHYTPPEYEFSRVVPGQKVAIRMGTHWSEGEDEYEGEDE